MDPCASLLLSTCPEWVSGAEGGGDGGPLEGVAQLWRDHWKQVWVPVVAEGLQVRGAGGEREREKE
jgi:hypothetical protein